MYIYILLVALTPVLVLLFYIYRKDKDQPEPKKEMAKAFLYGVVSVFVSLCISTLFSQMGLFDIECNSIDDAIRFSFFGAAIPEEIAKYLMLLLFLRKCNYFDQRMDGIVYAVCVSLGFAALENVMYLVGNYDTWVYLGISRALTAIPGHFVFGILMGYYYSLRTFDTGSFVNAKYKVLLIPILVHGIYDVICFSMDVLPYVAAILMILFLVFCHKLWKYGINRVKEVIVRDKIQPVNLGEQPSHENNLLPGDRFEQ